MNSDNNNENTLNEEITEEIPSLFSTPTDKDFIKNPIDAAKDMALANLDGLAEAFKTFQHSSTQFSRLNPDAQKIRAFFDDEIKNLDTEIKRFTNLNNELRNAERGASTTNENIREQREENLANVTKKASDAIEQSYDTLKERYKGILLADTVNKTNEFVIALKNAKRALQARRDTFQKTAVEETPKYNKAVKAGKELVKAEQERIFKEIIEKATTEAVNQKLGVKDTQSIEDIAKQSALSDLDQSKFTKEQYTELEKTVEVLHSGKDAAKELFDRLQKEVDNGMKAVFNNPGYKTIKNEFTKLIKNDQNEHLSNKFTLKKDQNGLKWDLTDDAKNEIENLKKINETTKFDSLLKNAKVINQLTLYDKLNASLIKDPLKNANKEFMDLLQGKGEEIAKNAETIWQKFVNTIKSLLGLEVKSIIDGKDLDAKQSRGGKRIQGKYTEALKNEPKTIMGPSPN